MIQIKVNSGVNISRATGLRRVSVDPKEAAAADIDGWRLLLTGGEKFARSDGSLVNRVERGKLATQLASNVVTQGVLPNTNFPAMVTEVSGSSNDYEPGFDMNPSAFTFFAVLHLPSGNGPDQIVFPKTVPADNAVIAPRIGFNTTGTFRIWRGDTTAEVSHGAGDPDYYDQTVYVMASGSVGRGLTLRRNGVEVAFGEAGWSGFDDPEFKLFEDFGGYIGDLGVLDIDLAHPDNLGGLLAVDDWMMTKYGL